MKATNYTSIPDTAVSYLGVYLYSPYDTVPLSVCLPVCLSVCLYRSKMADGRHLGKIDKSPYLSTGLTDHHEIWHGDATDFHDPSVPT